MEHKFKFNEQDVIYRSGTVRDRESLKLMLRKLYAQCGGYDAIPDVEREMMWDYANFIAYSSLFEADWRREPAASGEALYAGFAIFSEEPSDTYDLFRAAQTAVEQPEKKAEVQQEAIEIEDFMRQLVASEKGDTDEDAPPPPDALENDAGYAMETWLQHRVHHTYPEAGGYNDQDESLMRDWNRLNLAYIRMSMGIEEYSPDNEPPELMDVHLTMHD